jgi:uncharacterized protein YcbX
MAVTGKLESIWCYPTKSLASVALSQTEIGADGMPGDRARALIVSQGHARTGKTYRGKENQLLHLTDSIDRARSLAAREGVEVDVQAEQPHYFDAAPISLILDRWLDEASDLVGYRLEPLRFRPNLFAIASQAFNENELSLVGSRLAIGTTILQVREPIERCVTTTYDLKTGESDPDVLRAVAQHRGSCLGIYCDVLTPGRVRIGDDIVRQ